MIGRPLKHLYFKGGHTEEWLVRGWLGRWDVLVADANGKTVFRTVQGYENWQDAVAIIRNKSADIATAVPSQIHPSL